MRPLLRVVLLAHLLAASFVGTGAGQVRPVRLATRPGEVHFSQSTALLPDGRFAAVWTQGETVFLQYVDSNGGVAFAAPGRAVATVPSGAGAIVVAHARDGVLVAVRRRIDGGGSRILVQWLDGQGNPRWGRGTYAAPAAGREDQREPFLLASSDGGGFVCFVRAASNDPLGRSASYCQRFSPEGRRLWGTGGARARGSLSPPLSAEEPKAVAAGDGGLFVFWRDWDNVSDTPKILLRGQRLGPDGDRRWGHDGKIVSKPRFACDDGCSIGPPWISAVPDGAGGAIVAFDDRDGRLPEGLDFNSVTAQRMSAAGESVWGEGVSVWPSRPPHNLYDLYIHPDGGAVVAAVTFPFAFDGGIHLVFQRLAADGRPLWPTEGVTAVDPASSPDKMYEGAVYGSVDDCVLRVAWERSNTGFPVRSEIRFSAFDAAGNRLTPSDGVPLVRPTLTDDSLIRGFAFDPASGTSFMVWKDAMGAAAVLYAPR